MWGLDFDNSPNLRKWLAFSEEENSKLMKHLGTNEVDFENQVKELVDWVKQQDGLPKASEDPNFLSNLLIKRKCDINKTKEHIKAYFENLIHFSDDIRIFNLKRIRVAKERITMVPSSKLGPNFEVFSFIKINDLYKLNISNIEKFSYSIAIAMLSYHLQKFTSINVLLDFENSTIEDFLQVSPKLASKSIKMWRNVLWSSLSGIYILNSPPHLDAVLGLAKLMLPEKVFGRITICKDFDELHQFVQKDYLPSDWGGNLDSIENMAEGFQLAIDEAKEFFATVLNILPPSPIDENNYENGGVFGAQGSFRTLVLD